MATIAKGSHIKLTFSDGTTLGWRAEEDLPVERTLNTIRELASFDPDTAASDRRAAAGDDVVVDRHTVDKSTT
jgi:hypothetical protein